MLLPRVIPTLLLNENYLVKTTKFKNKNYLGDPINAVKIFNDKEADELTFLDISASINNRGPNYNLIEKIASEAFMPFSYGGGISNVDQINRLINIGVEKIIINSSALKNPDFINTAVGIIGSSGIVISVDYKLNWRKKNRIYSQIRGANKSINFYEYLYEIEKRGAGEIFLTSVDRDGLMSGYDYETIKKVSKNLTIPIVACGGAGNLEHIKKVIDSGASAAAGGSMFVYHGNLKGFLITYPSREKLEILFK